MKAKVKIFKTIPLISLLLLFIQIATGQTVTEVKNLSRSFKVKNTTTIEVDNKYGKMHVINWKKDSVKFEIEQIIYSSDYEGIEKMRKSVNYDFVASEFYITAKTNFGSSYNSFIQDLADFAESFVSNDNKVEVNYTISIPEYVNLKLNNKFGDIYIEDLIGDLTVNLSNGNLKASSLKGNSNITLNMGDAEINTVTNCRAILNYSEFHVVNANEINIDSKISKITIDNANVVKLLSRKDKLYLSQVKQLFGESYFSELNITRLDAKVNFKMKYSNITMDMVNREFSLIDLNTEYTDINIFFAGGSSYSIDINHKNAFLNIPEENANIKKEVLSEQDKEYYTYGTIGKGTHESKLKIHAIKGNINIQNKE